MIGGREAATVVVDGVRLAYEEHGVGPPMVFVHGFGASSLSWRLVATTLAQTHRTLAVDLMGFGRSDKPADQPYTMERQAALLRDFLTALEVENPVLVGHSYGGGVCLMLLRLYREVSLTSLVLVDSVCYPQSFPSFIRVLQTPVLRDLLFRLLPTEKLVRMVLARCYYRPLFIRADIVAAYAAALRSPGGKEAAVATAQRLLPQDLQGMLRSYRQIQYPTLLVWGEHDTVVPLANAKRLVTEIAGTRIKVLSECGHVPQEESPERVAQAISEYLSMLPKHRF